MRTLGLRRAAEREAAALDAGRRARGSRPSAPASTRPPPTARCRSSSSSCACASSPSRPADALATDEAPLVRPLDQLGARAPARRDDARARRRSCRRGSIPAIPRGNPVVLTPGAALEPATGSTLVGADRQGARHASASTVEATGSNNWAVSGDALGDRRTADGRRSPPPAEHARDHLPGRPLPRRSLLPRRLASRAARA